MQNQILDIELKRIKNDEHQKILMAELLDKNEVDELVIDDDEVDEVIDDEVDEVIDDEIEVDEVDQVAEIDDDEDHKSTFI